MDQLQLLLDLHGDAYRQGPGGDRETEKAIDLASLDRHEPLKILDIGCGTGASTLTLARSLSANITAVDLLQGFLDTLDARAQREGVAGNINTLCASMDQIPLAEGEFDAVWSEGAIYNIGFRSGVTAWKRFLKPGGVLVVSEISWLTPIRPAEIENHWLGEYAEIDTPSAKIKVLEESGYSPVAYFTLPRHCWWDNYYEPLCANFEAFLDRHGHTTEARAIVEAERNEIALYKQYNAYYSYGFYLARRSGNQD